MDAANETIETLSSAVSAAEVSEGSARKQAAKAASARCKSAKELEKVFITALLFAIRLYVYANVGCTVQVNERQQVLLAERALMEQEAEVVLVAQEQAKVRLRPMSMCRLTQDSLVLSQVAAEKHEVILKSITKDHAQLKGGERLDIIRFPVSITTPRGNRFAGEGAQHRDRPD